MTERRQQAQRRVKSVPVTVTIDRELMDFLEMVQANRVFRSRSHAVNAALDYLKWTLENEPTRFLDNGPLGQVKNHGLRYRRIEVDSPSLT